METLKGNAGCGEHNGERYCRQRVRSLSLLAVVALGCSSGDDASKGFAIAPVPSPTVPTTSPTRERARLVRLDTIGAPDGREHDTFGFIGGAAFGENGSIYVTDQYARRVAQHDSTGHFVRYFGRKGSGPGEFLSPTRITVHGDAVYVLDESLGRIITFDTSGTYRRSVPAPAAGMIGDLEMLRTGVLAVTHAADIGHPLSWVDSSGNTVESALREFSHEGALVPQTNHAGGSLCRRRDGTLVYANPWVYELIAFDSSGTVAWSRRIPSNIVLPRLVSEAQGAQGVVPGGLRQNAGPMGIACTDDAIVVGYIVLDEQAIYYDVLTRDGAPVAHVAYDLAGENENPGFIVDARGDQVLTYRGRPYPHVIIHRVTPAQP